MAPKGDHLQFVCPLGNGDYHRDLKAMSCINSYLNHSPWTLFTESFKGSFLKWISFVGPPCSAGSPFSFRLKPKPRDPSGESPPQKRRKKKKEKKETAGTHGGVPSKKQNQEESSPKKRRRRKRARRSQRFPQDISPEDDIEFQGAWSFLQGPLSIEWSSCVRNVAMLWMVAKSISHHLRNIGMSRFPCTNLYWFPMLSEGCRSSSVHSTTGVNSFFSRGRRSMGMGPGTAARMGNGTGTGTGTYG